MNCPRCNLIVEDGAFFCEHCGVSLADAHAQSPTTENIEQTMVIPIVKTDMAVSPSIADTASVKASVTSVSENKEKKSPVKKDLQTKIILMVISFAVTLAIGFGICAVVIFANSRTKANEVSKPQNNTQTVKTEKEKKPQEEPVELEEGTSEGKEEKTGISLDTDFTFKHGKKIASSELLYKTLKSTEFAYVCDIPSSFKFVSDADGEIRYRADDNTAYMDVGAFANEHKLSLDEIKTMVQEKLSGSVEREESGDDWFIMSTKSSGVVYYFKCYADEYIRYVEFAYPEEYRDIYDVYVSDIEPTFERLG